MIRNFIVGCLALPLLVSPAVAGASTLVVDRGLPTTNLNNAAGLSRSNAAWDDDDANSFYGDSFTLSGAAGTIYDIDTIRTWVVSTATSLGDLFSSVSLFTGIGGSLSETATGNFAGAGSNATSNANISISSATYVGGVSYQSVGGSPRNMFEVDFTGLDIQAAAGTTISFGVDGLGVDDPSWFTHASNAALSGSPQDGADGLMMCYARSGAAATSCGVYDSNGDGWDKSSDLNVQVFADVPEPASMALLATGVLGIGTIRRRRAGNAGALLRS
ncbi:MAG TPA: PEP-CTERM sorting domain-containing protein [Rhodopila sp.]